MTAVASIQSDTVAGPFRVSYCGPGNTKYDGTAMDGMLPSVRTLGIIGSRGVRQIRRFEGEDFSGDLLGNSVIDSVYLGGQMFLEFELEEANKTNVMAIINPFIPGAQVATPTTDSAGRVGVPGTLATAKCGSLQLHPLYSVAGGNVFTKAGAQVTPVRTYGLVTLAAGFDMEQLLGSKRRTIPIRLRCYPYLWDTTTDEYVWYNVAALASSYLTE